MDRLSIQFTSDTLAGKAQDVDVADVQCLCWPRDSAQTVVTQRHRLGGTQEFVANQNVKDAVKKDMECQPVGLGSLILEASPCRDLT